MQSPQGTRMKTKRQSVYEGVIDVAFFSSNNIDTILTTRGISINQIFCGLCTDRCNVLLSEKIDVILTTRGIGEANPGILFGYHEFTNTYRLSVSTSSQNWELRLPNSSLSWSHLCITWSKNWGLRFYRDGVLIAEATKPMRRPYTYYDNYHQFRMGRDSSNPQMTWGNNFQVSDIRIWESAIPQQKVEEVHRKAGNFFTID